MKTNFLTLLVTMFVTTVCAQVSSHSYFHYKKVALELYKAGKFEEAINNFKVAEICEDAPASNDIDVWIDSCNAGYVRVLKQERDKAYQAEKRARQEAEANSIAGLALKTMDENPTHALRIAAYGREKYPENKVLAETFFDILGATPSPFYERKLDGHQLPVSSVASNSDGSLIATGGWNHNVNIWDRKGNLIKELVGHNDIVSCVAVFKNHPFALSGSADQTLIQWDLNTGSIIKVFKGHKLDITAVAISPDETKIATVSADGNMKLWQLDGKEILNVKAHDDFATSVLFINNGTNLLTTGKDGYLCLWDTQTGKLSKKNKAHASHVMSSALSPNGQYIATCGWDKKVKLWDVALNPLGVFTGHDAAVEAICFSSDSRYIYSSGWDSYIITWEVSGKLLNHLKGHTGKVNQLTTIPADNTLLSAGNDNLVFIWNTQNIPIKTHNANISAVSYSPSGDRYVTIGSDTKLNLWDKNGKLKKQIPMKSNPKLVKFSPTGDKFIVGIESTKNQLLLFNSNGDSLRTWGPFKNAYPRSVDFSSDGNLVVSGGYGDFAILNLATGKDTLFSALKDHHIFSIKIIRGNSQILAGASNRKVTLFNLDGVQLMETNAKLESPVWDILVAKDEISFYTAAGKQVTQFNMKGEFMAHKNKHDANIIRLRGFKHNDYIVSSAEDSFAKVCDSNGNELQVIGGVRSSVLETTPNDSIITADEDGSLLRTMLFNDYLSKGHVYELTNKEMAKYGLSTDTSAQVEVNKSADLPSVKHHIKAQSDEIKLFMASGYDTLEPMRYYGMSLSQKAYYSKSIESKIQYQTQSTKQFDGFETIATAMGNRPNVGGYNTHSFSYGMLSLWHLMAGDTIESMLNAKICRAKADSANYHKIIGWSKVVMALNQAATSEFTQAVPLLESIQSSPRNSSITYGPKNSLYEVKDGTMKQLFDIMQLKSIPENFTYCDLIKEYLKLLNEANVKLRNEDAIITLINSNQ